jgi:hypothetical protein
MFWFVLCLLFSCLVDLFTVRQLTDAQKDIQMAASSRVTA